jgi:hypothetical protein
MAASQFDDSAMTAIANLADAADTTGSVAAKA